LHWVTEQKRKIKKPFTAYGSNKKSPTAFGGKKPKKNTPIFGA